MFGFLKGRPAKFMPRSPERDRENDELRIASVLASIAEAAQNIASEAEGLRTRYGLAQADASMFLYAAEGEGVSTPTDRRLDHLERSVVYYECRIAELARQSDLLEKVMISVKEALEPEKA